MKTGNGGDDQGILLTQPGDVPLLIVLFHFHFDPQFIFSSPTLFIYNETSFLISGSCLDKIYSVCTDDYDKNNQLINCCLPMIF